ncbi:MAG: phosphoenolpyruvate--protein phosphotransferase [Pseudomonadota bacterium]
MLNVLRRIVQEVNAAAELDQALDIIVLRIKQFLKVDVCSVYLATDNDQELVLMATDGLNPKAENKVRLRFSEGLVGLVAQRAEPVNIRNAAQHPRYKYFPETGEKRYQAFLGIPIVHKRKMLGVLVVQQHDERGFDEEHTAFLITLAAQLASTISHAGLSGDIGSLTPKAGHTDVLIKGVSGAPGVGIGLVVILNPHADLDSVPDRKPGKIKHQIHSLKRAVRKAQKEMFDIKASMGKRLPAEERAIFDAFVMMMGSDTLVDDIIGKIRAGNWAPGALRQTIVEHVGLFEKMEDSYLRERADDIRAIGRRILKHLQKNERHQGGCPDHVVLVGDDISVAELAEIPSKNLVGVVSGRGSRSSHVAILARALGVPAIMGVGYIPILRLDGRKVIVDGYTGQLHIEPSRQVREEFFRLEAEERELAQGLSELDGKPAITRDGERIPVYVNSGLLADLSVVFQTQSDGIGLYRTEFPFMVRDRFPGEDEQCNIYRQILEEIAPRPVTLRTLDMGGDKVLPYFPIKEDNPFLGWRGIRVMLDHPEIFLTQLRAMLRASAGLNNMQILFPMINSLSEVDDALGLMHRAWYELLDEDVNTIVPQVGVMVEVPSAVYLAEKLARKVDFLSIGTNDLVQYMLAIDRNNSLVSNLYHTLHPAVIEALIAIVEGAHRAKKPVSICGEMATDPASVILLLGMGIDSLSVSVAGLTRVKWVIGSFSRARAKELLDEVRELDDPVVIRDALNDALVKEGLGGLVRAGKQ